MAKNNSHANSLPVSGLPKLFSQPAPRAIVGVVCFGSLLGVVFLSAGAISSSRAAPSLWEVYLQSFKRAKYVDLTHAIAPSIPIWSGFGRPTFKLTLNPETGAPYTYKQDGFESTRYELPTAQMATQLDPPAHGNPDYPAIDELPATYTLRPLVVIPIQTKVAKDPAYHLTVKDILTWEQK